MKNGKAGGVEMKAKAKIFVICMLLTGVLAACGGGGEETAATEEGGANAEGSRDNVTIKLHTHGNVANYNWKETLAAFE